ncbi:sugar ABC transporter ATP-binding protein [Nocardioides aquiterrae]|uniref:Sugar ABC transporter ATP-binding protein n=1 Tax=Nocardioides aquiterrae TaxID=203799 RepID=A0ABN1U6X4_9ACTN
MGTTTTPLEHDPALAPAAPLLEMSGISKRYLGVQALDRASLRVNRGEIHALLGGNGAGKSTLLNVLSGTVKPDEGTIELDGEPVSVEHPREAHRLGIVTIHQELSTLPDLTVLENILLGNESALGARGGVLVNRRQVAARVAPLAAEFGITRAELWRPVAEFGALKKRAIEIVKALAAGPKILILDEPTSGLEEHEKTLLFDHMRGLQHRGVALIWVTHHLDELFGLADVATVMRDGRTMATVRVESVSQRELVSHMFGGEAAELLAAPAAHRRSGDDGRQAGPRLRVTNVSRPGVLRDVSFDLYPGEVLGIAGLAGAGRTELVRVLMGLDKASSGHIAIDGKVRKLNHPRKAYRAGLAMVPEDRKQMAVLTDFSVAETISISRLRAVCVAGLLSGRRERTMARSFVQQLGIKTPSSREKVRNLSGGNQQKAIIARCLNTKPSILIFDEPTQGIDVHAKAEVHRLVRELVDGGTSVILIASEFSELISLSDRVIILNRGSLVGEVDDIGRRVTEDGIEAVKDRIIDRASRASK